MTPGSLKRLLSFSGLITVPGVIALLIWLLAVPMWWIDQAFDAQQFSLYGVTVILSPETARAVLQTIATGAITTLSLVYSLVLVVFTLAAGNIAPRLLKRFTEDRVNQVTAGLLGGTFLFALTVLYHTNSSFIPIMSITVAMVLAVIFVLQLVYFVHSVSRSVTIDEEIAVISGRLEQRISKMVRSEKEKDDGRVAPGTFDFGVAATRSGYLSSVDENALLALACKCDMAIKLRFKPGDFILETQNVAYLSREPEEKSEEIEEALHACLVIWPSRDALNEIEYSINLLVEIALRALSPGVNDTFTAIASLDRMTAAFSAAVRFGLRGRDIVDDDRIVRAMIPGPNLKDMLDMAFHPLRRVSAGNMLMMEHLAQALTRLHEIGNPEARKFIASHAKLLLDSAHSARPLEEDFASLKTLLPFLEDEKETDHDT